MERAGCVRLGPGGGREEGGVLGAERAGHGTRHAGRGGGEQLRLRVWKRSA